MILGVAIRKLERGILLAGARPARHGDLLNYAHSEYPEIRAWECGFYTEVRRFCTRQEAYQIALDAGQITGPGQIPGRLFSEEIW